MNSNRKQQAQCQWENGEDRISSLTDDVLCHILSFLPTKYAVGTSVLSKRWEQVWTSVPNLDLDDSLLLRQGMLNEEAAQTCFSKFVNKVLSLHNLTCVKKFHLRCSLEYDLSLADPWICAAIIPGVEDLNLCIDILCTVPQTLYYTCRNLVHLKLEYLIFVLHDSASVFLPQLKTLQLSVVYFADNNSLKNLLFGCPVLKDLYIRREKPDYALSLYVCSTSLERLTMRNFMDLPDGTVYDLLVEAPNLKHLDLQGYSTENYEIKNLLSLVSANINVLRSDVEKYPVVVQLLKDISNVKKLQLLGDTTDDLSIIGYDNLPVFQNLTYLMVDYIPIVPYFLERSPILKSLVIENVSLYLVRRPDYWGFWETPGCVYGCLLTHLLKIKIGEFVGREDEIEMIGYFLKNSMVLEMLSIHSIGLSSKKKLVILENLWMLPRGSIKCQIALH